MAVIQGSRSVATLLTEERATRDVSPGIIQLEPDAGPLVTILAKLRKRPTTQRKFEWVEDQLLPRFDVLGGNLTAVASSMTVTNYKYFRKGDLVRVNKGEIVYVTATPTTTSVSISRAFGETVAAAASAGDQLHIIANTSEDGATLGSILTTQRVVQYNYTQIMRHPFGFTTRNIQSGQYGEDDLKTEQAKQLIELKKSMELQLILGERYTDTSGTYEKNTTRGILKWISSNTQDMGGEMTEDELENFLRRSFRYGSKKKIAFCSSKVLQVVNGFGREKLNTRSDESSYGITMTEYKNAGKMLELVEHYCLENDVLTDLTGLAGTGIIVDIADLELRYMGSKFVELKTNRQANDEEIRKDEYYSDVGLQLAQEKKHGYFFGVTE